MRIAIATLESRAIYSQSKHHETPKLDKESADDYERRTWRERLHVNSAGFVEIPPAAFKNCVAEAAKFLGKQIPGKGKATYTKHFEAGILVLEPLVLPIKKEDVVGDWHFVPADGRPGGGRRVNRCFGSIPQWSGRVTFHIIDDTITEGVFREHLEQAGQFIGIGRFRPRNRGFYGRFDVTGLEWK